MNETAVEAIQCICNEYKGTLITRRVLSAMSGGSLTVKTLANMDYEGTGVPGSFKMGKTICYPLDLVTTWLIKRIDPTYGNRDH